MTDIKPPFETPKLIEFKDADEKRRHQKIRLAATFRLFGKFGFNEGPAGHVTLRDPEDRNVFWVNPFGQHFSQVRVSDLILVDHKGEVVEGAGQVNKAAYIIHSAVHAARPDVDAAAHTHSIYGRSWAALARKLDPITQDACAFYQDHGLFDDYTGVVLDKSEGTRLAVALGKHKACILKNHGLLTVGGCVESAAFWYIFMESACRAQLMAEAAGTPKLIDPGEAEKTHGQIGSELSGWFSFQPLFDTIIAAQPDLVE